VPEPPKPRFTVDIDINHSNQKHILTRGTFVDQVCRSSGAVVTLKGAFRKIGATNPCKDPCLHLHVVAEKEEDMKAAEEMIKAKMGEAPLPAFEYSEMLRLGCEVPWGFDAITQIEGPDQEYFKHVMAETSTKLILVGRGATKHQDLADGLMVYIGAKDLKAVQDASALVENLLSTVRTKCEAHVPDFTQQQPLQAQVVGQRARGWWCEWTSGDMPTATGLMCLLSCGSASRIRHHHITPTPNPCPRNSNPRPLIPELKPQIPKLQTPTP
jgi:hypothetical protein